VLGWLIIDVLCLRDKLIPEAYFIIVKKILKNNIFYIFFDEF